MSAAAYLSLVVQWTSISVLWCLSKLTRRRFFYRFTEHCALSLSVMKRHQRRPIDPLPKCSRPDRTLIAEAMSSITVEPFVYTRLQWGYIRLLKPVMIAENFLEFEVVQVPRFPLPRYIAISYAWGDQDPSKVVYLDGKSSSVRPNLWSCLYHLCGVHARHLLRRYVWVDAICINQQDNVERNEQVSAMSNTYEYAEVVSVWLGERIEEAHHRCTPYNDHILYAKTSKRISLQHNRAWRDEFIRLANNKYWTRTWIIQELLLAKQIHIYWGECHIRFQDFQKVLKAIDPGRTHLASPIFEKKEGPTRIGPWPLEDLLISYSQSECRDPRDRVFALLGLAYEKQSLHFFPDYRLSTEEVIVLTLLHLLKHTDGTAMYPSGVRRYWNITPASDELFAGFGLETSTRRQRETLLDAAKEVYSERIDSGLSSDGTFPFHSSGSEPVIIAPTAPRQPDLWSIGQKVI